MEHNPQKTAEELTIGNRLALAKAISSIENETQEGEEILRLTEHHTGKAYLIGITGPPGVGKSSLTSLLASRLRKENKKIGIIAIDPSSPFSGGAVLGDRIRMKPHNSDENVFVRSMGSRGALGGLAFKTAQASRLMDAFGMDVIIIETVGVGQSEIEIARTADLVVVALAPGFGDGVQAMKAGILEIADIFAVNKSDLAGADKLAAELSGNYADRSNDTPVIKTNCLTNEGLEELLNEIRRLKKSMLESGIFIKRRNERKEQELKNLIQNIIKRRTEAAVNEFGGIKKLLEINGGNVFQAAETVEKKNRR